MRYAPSIATKTRARGLGAFGRNAILVRCTPIGRSAALLLLCALPSWCSGQAGPEGSGGLKILIVEGEGAINNLRQRTAREPIVEVSDENNRPVAGALVVFLLPSSGPSGAFANGLQTLTVTTDSAGRAVATGFRPNQVTGQFKIDVQASFENRTARAAISQQIISRSPWLSWKTAAAAAAVVIATVFIVRGVRDGGGNSTDASIGRPTVGPR